MKDNKKKDKKPAIKTRTRMDNSIEVEFQKNPAKTLFGKILLFLVILGMGVLPIVGLILVLLQLLD